MRQIVALLVLVSAVGCGGPAPTPAQVACRPTQPNGDGPAGEPPGPHWYGNGRLYTTALQNKGEILAEADVDPADGSISSKFAWWRAPGLGVAGDLRITGHEVNSGAAITATIPDGYGQQFQASGISFPREGCYEITATSGNSQLLFEVKVTNATRPVSSP